MLSEYTDFADIFSPKLVAELLEHGISNHAIKLVDNRQPPYGFIYSLGPIELESLKIYIKNNLVNGFIRPSKSSTRASILFDNKLDANLRLCLDYQYLNNLIMKNWYLLPLIRESLDQLDQLDLTNAYNRISIREGDK